jgi:hypothetical protein
MAISQEEYNTIEEILEELYIQRYTINDDGTVDVAGNVDISRKGLKEIPVQFGEVTGTFDCTENKLSTLEGAPIKVGGSFDCHDNKLTSLEYAPKEVGAAFACTKNKLSSLEGSPKEVSGGFYCSRNNLSSLKGAPEYVGRDFDCAHNNFTSFEGAPKKIGGDFYGAIGNESLKSHRGISPSNVVGRIVLSPSYTHDVLEKLVVDEAYHFFSDVDSIGTSDISICCNSVKKEFRKMFGKHSLSVSDTSLRGYVLNAIDYLEKP